MPENRESESSGEKKVKAEGVEERKTYTLPVGPQHPLYYRYNVHERRTDVGIGISTFRLNSDVFPCESVAVDVTMLPGGMVTFL